MTRQSKAELIERIETVISYHGELIESYELSGNHEAAVPHYDGMHKCRALWFRIMDSETVD